MEKRCAAFHRQRPGLKNPVAGNTGLPEPLQGLPDDPLEIARTAPDGTGSPPESRERGDWRVFGVCPETAASYLFRITPHGFPSLRREPGGDGLPIFKKDT